MGNESRIAQAQKADLWDRAVVNDQIQQQVSQQAARQTEQGYAAGIMDGIRKTNMSWANTLKHKLYNTPEVVLDTDVERMKDGSLVNSVGTGLAGKMAQQNAAQDAWVAQSISPRADTPYPTYKGK